MSHVPVLLTEVIRALGPTDGEHYVDGTFGAGGYTAGILRAANCHVLGLDRDPNVRPSVDEISAEFGDRFTFVETEFSNIETAVGDRQIDGVVLDIGVSSMQLDQGERGFSFMRDGPLDMRMSGQGPDAADAVNHLQHNELIEIFKVYGEEKRARRCADFIVRAREEKAITTTLGLAEVLTSALGHGSKHHPATRVFQALRIYVNDELGELYRALLATERLLRPGGRLVVVTFHSLEDRIVKSFLRSRSEKAPEGSRHLPPSAKASHTPSFKVTKRSGVVAGPDEISINPRSRSARLRWGIRTDAPVWRGEERILPEAPSLDMLARRVA
jgi:16S rRNA (cytosine1402-N4)-methyltransferase